MPDFNITFLDKEPFNITFGEVTEVSDLPAYEGAYEVTPSEETQTLATANKKMTANVVINPIPSNWGKIGWNGATLTVS